MSERPHAGADHVTRRRFLGASVALTATVAAATALRCGDGKRRTQTTATPSPGPEPSRVPVATRGGVARVYNFAAMQYDTLDPHLTQMGPVVDMHAAVYSRVLRYDDERSLKIAPDLAAAMPEQPDETTYIIRLRENLTFHAAANHRYAYPKTAGRALTADDVKSSIERQMNRNSAQRSRFFRAGNWSVVDKMDVRDPQTLVITTKSPVAPFLSFLAGRHAFVIPREVADRTDQITNVNAIIGTGPFMLESFEAQREIRLRRNPSWFARDDAADDIGAGRPFLDGYEAFFSPQEDTFQRVAFERRIVDSTAFGDSAALGLERKTNLADIALDETDAGGMLACRLLLDRAPFRDDRVRRAIHLAIDRSALADLIYPQLDGKASAKLTGAIAPAMDAFAIAPDDLRRRPGYRTDAAGRDADRTMAKQLWTAALGDGAVNELRVLFTGVPKIIPDRGIDALVRQLRDVLGVNVNTATDGTGHALIAASYLRNIEGATEGVVPFTFALEDGGVDLDDWLYPQFRSGQPMNTYRLQDPQLDALLDKSRAEFDNDARRKIGLDAQDYLLAKVNARLEICAPIERRLTWGYLRNHPVPMWYGSTQALADVWLDTAHPAWRPRPT